MARSAASPEGVVLLDAVSCCSPSTSRVSELEYAPLSLCTLLTMASKTGCASVGELLITFKISLVAVCRLSAVVRS